MSWRKFLLLPRLAPAILGRTPEPDAAWEAYWRHVQRTGPEGEVLWDGAGEEELRWWLDTARQYLDPTLPVIDVGCGNGRLSRLLAAEFPAVVGVDHSQAALDHAQRESVGTVNVRFRRLDVTAPGAGGALARELGPANVVVRGVFHILDREHRRRAAANLAQIIHGRGCLLVLETNWPRDLLEYLEYLGGRNGRLPDPLARLIDDRLPAPSSFGPAELAEMFPQSEWTEVSSGETQIAPVRLLRGEGVRPIPGFFAVLRSSQRTPDSLA